MLLGDMTEQTANECGECGRIQPELKNKCAFCRGSQLVPIPADEALVRLALVRRRKSYTSPPWKKKLFMVWQPCCAVEPGVDSLFRTQRLDGIEIGCFSGRVVSKADSHKS